MGEWRPITRSEGQYWSSGSIDSTYPGRVYTASAVKKGGSKMTNIILYLLLGLFAGTFSGLIGIGGGTIIVPILVFLFGLSQHQAQGTTLALLVPPIGFLAAWTYYKQGYVDLKIASLICIGFFLGGLIGAKFATKLSNVTLERVFGVALLLISLKMIFAK
jgi:uncharacterized membrane protein YfcA